MAREFDPQLAEMGKKIVARREELGMTATELAVYIDVTPATLSRIESGQSAARADTLFKIASVLKISLDRLQPQDLNQYSDMPNDLSEVISKFKQKSVSDQSKLVKMFLSMVEII